MGAVAAMSSDSSSFGPDFMPSSAASYRSGCSDDGGSRC